MHSSLGAYYVFGKMKMCYSWTISELMLYAHAPDFSYGLHNQGNTGYYAEAFSGYRETWELPGFLQYSRVIEKFPGSRTMFFITV